MHWFFILLAILFVIICVLLILIILIQPGQSEGLTGTFGSGGMLGSAFGVHMKNRLAKFTTIMVILFFAIIFIFALKSDEEESPVDGVIDAEHTENSLESDHDKTPDDSLSPDAKETEPAPDKKTPEEKPDQETEKD